MPPRDLVEARFIYIRGEYRTRTTSSPLHSTRRATCGLLGDVDARRSTAARGLYLRRGNGAPGVARGQAWPAAVEAAVPGDPGPLCVADADQQRRDDRERAERARDRPRGVREDRLAPDSTGTRVFCLSGNVLRPGSVRGAARDHRRHLIYDLGGGIADGRELKAVMVGGSSSP